MIKVVTNNNAEEIRNSKLAVVDFSATWCGPCRMVAPVIEQLSEEMAGEADFFNVDCDENEELARQYRISSIPAILIVKNGTVVATTVGFQPKDALKAYILRNK